MKEVFSFFGALFGLVSIIHAQEIEDLTVARSFSLSMPKAGLGQLDFSGKPHVKKEKQIKLLCKNTIKHGHVQDPELTWDWGFRTGIGLNTVIKNWNLIATYTKFHTKPFVSVATPEGIVLPTWKDASLKGTPAIQENSLAWRLHLNLADMELGRNFEPVEKVALRPHIGIRGAWIYQRHRKPQDDVEDLNSRRLLFLSNNCVGLGCRSGLDSLWKVSRGVSLFGDGALSWLAGYYNINSRRPLAQNNPEEKKPIANSIATAELSLGMQYETLVFERKFFTFRIGYEMNYIFSQTRWMDWFGHAQESSGGISLQGLTMGLRLDF